MNNVLSVVGAILTVVWGIAHLIPTANVVRDFGEISEDNKQIVRMEWINEGVTLIFIGALALTALISSGSIPDFLRLSLATMLSVMSVISLLTGFKIKFLPFKLCPVIFMTSAILFILDMFI